MCDNFLLGRVYSERRHLCAPTQSIIIISRGDCLCARGNDTADHHHHHHHHARRIFPSLESKLPGGFRFDYKRRTREHCEHCWAYCSKGTARETINKTEEKKHTHTRLNSLNDFAACRKRAIARGRGFRCGVTHEAAVLITLLHTSIVPESISMNLINRGNSEKKND